MRKELFVVQRPRIANFLFYSKIYMKLVGLHIKSRLAYREDFLIGLGGMLITNLVGILALWLVFDSVDNILGWSYNEIIFIYAFTLMSTLPFQLFFDNVWQLNGKLVDGSFIKYYFKPLNIMFYFISETVDIKAIGQLLISLAAFGYSCSTLDVDWNIPLILCALMLLISSALVMIGIMLLASATGFWVLNGTFALLFAFKLKDFSHYPMEIYNTVFKSIFTYLIPIGFVGYYPARFILRENQYSQAIFLTPLVGVVTVSVAYVIWMKGARQYAGTGT